MDTCRDMEASSLHDEIYLMYSDNFALIDLKNLEKTHKKNNKIITLSVVKKNPGNIVLDDKKQPTSYSTQRSGSSPFVEIGYMYLNFKKILKKMRNNNNEFNSIISSLINEKQANSILNNISYYSISDPKRRLIAEKYLEKNNIILLDRDGVINEKAPEWDYIKKLMNFFGLKKV